MPAAVDAGFAGNVVHTRIVYFNGGSLIFFSTYTRTLYLYLDFIHREESHNLVSSQIKFLCFSV